MSAPTVTLASFYLEVRAEDRADLGDKLYGYDDLEAENIARGLEPRALTYDETRSGGVEPVSEDEVRAIQAEQDTVNDLLRRASFDGHGVLFKTDGTNLGGPPSEATEIPHFGHGSANCDDVRACEGGNVYRLFPSADLVLAGRFTPDQMGRYRLAEDVHVVISGVAMNPEPGTDAAERIERGAVA